MVVSELVIFAINKAVSNLIVSSLGHPLPSSTEMVYVISPVRVAMGSAIVVPLRPVEGVHVIVAPVVDSLQTVNLTFGLLVQLPGIGRSQPSLPVLSYL